MIVIFSQLELLNDKLVLVIYKTKQKNVFRLQHYS